MLGKVEGRKRRRQQRMRWLDGITAATDVSLSKPLGDGEGQGSLACCSPWGRRQLNTVERLNKNLIQKTQENSPKKPAKKQ